MPELERIALVDMDGTIADFDGQLQKDLDAMRAPGEQPYETHPGDHPDYIEARASAIKRVPGWWRNLPRYEPGFRIVDLLKGYDFRIHILTKGPFHNTGAWAEKVDWVRVNLPEATISITEDKGLSYGAVLVDDWAPYALRWLEHRPRGLVIMPAHPWNEGFDHPRGKHPNVVRFTGTLESLEEVKLRIEKRLGVIRLGF